MVKMNAKGYKFVFYFNFCTYLVACNIPKKTNNKNTNESLIKVVNKKVACGFDICIYFLSSSFVWKLFFAILTKFEFQTSFEFHSATWLFVVLPIQKAHLLSVWCQNSQPGLEEILSLSLRWWNTGSWQSNRRVTVREQLPGCELSCCTGVVPAATRTGKALRTHTHCKSWKRGVITCVKPSTSRRYLQRKSFCAFRPTHGEC